jgi:flagellar basal body-associated protein FliL
MFDSHFITVIKATLLKCTQEEKPMKQQRKTSVIICIAVLLAAVIGLTVYTSTRLKSPGTEANNAENNAAVDSAAIRALPMTST